MTEFQMFNSFMTNIFSMDMSASFPAIPSPPFHSMIRSASNDVYSNDVIIKMYFFVQMTEFRMFNYFMTYISSMDMSTHSQLSPPLHPQRTSPISKYRISFLVIINLRHLQGRYGCNSPADNQEDDNVTFWRHKGVFSHTACTVLVS